MPLKSYSYQTDCGICSVENYRKNSSRHKCQPYGTAQFADTYSPIRISSVANEFSYKDDYCIRRNSDILSIEFVTKGSFLVSQFGQEHHVKENEIFFIQPGAPYNKYSVTANYAEKWYIVMTGPLLKQSLELLGLAHCTHFRPINPDRLMEFINRIYALLQKATPQSYRLACAECYSMLLEISAQNMEEELPPQLRDAIDFMQSNVDGQLSLDVIAAHCGISKVSLYRAFKKHFQKSPIDYFLDLKMKKAERLLKMKTFSVKQIASELNYASQQYFAMEFRKRYNVSPKQYQKSGPPQQTNTKNNFTA